MTEFLAKILVWTKLVRSVPHRFKFVVNWPFQKFRPNPSSTAPVCSSLLEMKELLKSSVRTVHEFSAIKFGSVHPATNHMRFRFAVKSLIGLVCSSLVITNHVSNNVKQSDTTISRCKQGSCILLYCGYVQSLNCAKPYYGALLYLQFHLKAYVAFSYSNSQTNVSSISTDYNGITGPIKSMWVNDLNHTCALLNFPQSCRFIIDPTLLVKKVILIITLY